MDWPIDELVTMDDDDISQWLTDEGLPGVSFLFVDPDTLRSATWTAAGEAGRRRALESLRLPN